MRLQSLAWLAAVCIYAPIAVGQPPSGSGVASPAAPKPAAKAPPTPPPANFKPVDKIRPEEFRLLDRNADGSVVIAVELNTSQRTLYGQVLETLDTNKDGRVTRDEFNKQGVEWLLSDLRGLAALLLFLGFGAFCVFIDSLLDYDRREYLWWAAGAAVLTIAAGYFCAPRWYLNSPPYVAFLAAVPVVVVGLAIAFGAAREPEERPVTAAPGGDRIVIGAGGRVVGKATPGAAKPAAVPGTPARPAAPGAAAAGEPPAGPRRPQRRFPPRPPKPPPRASDN
jgi:hypothetical protein